MPEEETITFEFIRKIHRDELRETRLTKLPDNFFQKVNIYLTQKKQVAEKKGDPETSMEVRNIEMILEDIFNRRETKLMNHAIITARTDVPPTNLTDEEKEFFESIVESLRVQRQRILNALFKVSKEKKKPKPRKIAGIDSKEKPEVKTEQETEELEKVEFLEDTPEFMGIDLKKYGPFNKGDVSEIPKENAEILKSIKKVK